MSFGTRGEWKAAATAVTLVWILGIAGATVLLITHPRVVTGAVEQGPPPPPVTVLMKVFVNNSTLRGTMDATICPFLQGSVGAILSCTVSITNTGLRNISVDLIESSGNATLYNVTQPFPIVLSPAVQLQLSANFELPHADGSYRTTVTVEAHVP